MNQKQIDALEPEAKTYWRWDPTLAGFGVRVAPSGTVTYLLRYRVKGGPQRTHALGRRDELSLKDARTEAQKLTARVNGGEDPRGQVPGHAVTVEALCERFLAEHSRVYKKPKSVTADELLIRVHVKPNLGHILTRKLTRAQIQHVHGKMKKTPYQANRFLALMSKMMNLAEVWEIRAEGTNPCRHVKRFNEEVRDVSVEPTELQKLAQAIENHPVRRDALAVKLLLVTGCRKMEILKAKWKDVKLELGILILPDSKTGRDVVVLNSAAIEIIEELMQLRKDGAEYIFGGAHHNIRRFWETIRKTSGLAGIRIHDLRHIFGSAVHEDAGGSQKTVQGLLRHKQASTTERYIHARRKTLRDASEKTGQAISSLFAT